jgi:hypothetical protein
MCSIRDYLRDVSRLRTGFLVRIFEDGGGGLAFKVHELISARLKIEKREQQSAVVEQRTKLRRQISADFFARLFRRRPTSQIIESAGPTTQQ